MTDLTPKTPEQFVAASKAIAGSYLDMVARQGLAPQDAANLFCAAIGEVLGQQIGPVEAIDRLRDVADILERQLLETRTTH